MTFRKVYIILQVRIYNFGRGGNVALFGQEVIIYDKLYVFIGLTDGGASHIPNAEEINLGGEQLAKIIGQFSHIVYNGSLVKLHIVSTNFGHIPLFEVIKQNFADIEKTLHYPLAVLYIFPILRHFVGVVSTRHQFFVEEDFRNHERTGADNSPCLIIENGITNIVGERSFQAVCGFGVDNHFVHFKRSPFLSSALL
jgi:hypothetical protein